MGSLKKLTDQELVALLKNGDAPAYTEIFFRYNRVLVAHAYRLLADRDAAQDLVQDLFLTLWQKRETFQLGNSLSAYLYTAARNKVFDRMSHQGIVDRYMDAAMRFVETGSAPSDERIIEKELTALVDREIRQLPEKTRQAFILRKQQELSYTEVAVQLGISEAAAKQQVYNAVKALRVKLSDLLLTLLF